MANTALLQTAIQMLMQGRPQSPISPVPTGPMTPPGGVFPGLPAWTPPPVMPEPAPVAPAPALDQSLIEQLAGPRPVAPVTQPDSLLQKISRMLIGFGAGTQGQGPQYLAGLREERERPRREFRAATEQYETRRAGAVELAERRRERQQEQTQRRADEASRRDFEAYLARSNFIDDEAKARLRHGFDLALQRETERAADERLEKQQKLAFGKELGEQIKFYRANGVSDAAQAKRLALNDFAEVAQQLGYTVPPLTEGDNKQLAKVGATIDRLNRLSRGGAAAGGGSRLRAAEKAAAEFDAVKNAAIEAAQRGDTQAESLHRKRLDALLRHLGQFSDLIESGYGAGGWPYQKPRGQGQPQASAPQQPQQQMRFNLNEDSQPQAGMTRQQAKAALQAEGYSDAEAEAELNRLGVR